MRLAVAELEAQSQLAVCLHVTNVNTAVVVTVVSQCTKFKFIGQLNPDDKSKYIIRCTAYSHVALHAFEGLLHVNLRLSQYRSHAVQIAYLSTPPCCFQLFFLQT